MRKWKKEKEDKEKLKKAELGYDPYLMERIQPQGGNLL